MKTSSAILSLLLAQSAAAFAPASQMASTSALSVATPVIAEPEAAPAAVVEESETAVSKIEVEEVDPSIYDPKKRVQTGRYNDKENSIAIPFLKRPTNLDGTHAGDIGFDPLGLSESNDLYTMMEAEIRHARLAMLAVVGWPLSEMNAPDWMLHGPNHLAPSVLNGFDPLSFISVAAILGGFGYFEYKTSLRRVDNTELGKKHKEDMANVWKYGVPGDYNFDPLGLYNMFGDSADARKGIREMEIAHGRAAMLGITSFAAWEALTGHPVIENSLFFEPNAVLPALGLAYFAFPFFYEIKNTDQYFFQIEMTSEGAARKEAIKSSMAKSTASAQVLAGEAAEFMMKAAEVTSATAKDLKIKYDKLNVEYTEKVMDKNINN